MTSAAEATPEAAAPRRAIAIAAVVLWAIVILITATIAVSFAWPAIAPPSMLVFAHHGDPRWPENSVEGIVAAIDLQPDGIEIDVRESASGTFWMFHDEVLDDSTDGSGAVREHSDDELQALRLDGGLGFDPVRHANVRLATMDQGLDALDGFGGLIMVDLKDRSTAAHGRLAEELAVRLDPGRVYVIVQSIEGARLVKAIDERFTTLYWRAVTWDPAIDAWIAHAGVQVDWPSTTVVDLFGSIAMFFEGTHTANEAALLDNGRRWGVSLVITNDVAAAMAWKTSTHAGPP